MKCTHLKYCVNTVVTSREILFFTPLAYEPNLENLTFKLNFLHRFCKTQHISAIFAAISRDNSHIFSTFARHFCDFCQITRFPYRSPLPKNLEVFKGGSVKNPESSCACGELFRSWIFVPYYREVYPLYSNGNELLSKNCIDNCTHSM